MKREEILESARTCVCTDRNKQYGEPEDTATDVALMLIEFKVARAITAKTPKSDTFIDIAGYAACGGEIATQPLRGENAELCMYCGEIIPEGLQVCPKCEAKMRQK